jgi:DNA-directed RNA polymerase specialized sigma24 family protein
MSAARNPYGERTTYNRVLDLWAAEASGAEIAARLGLNLSYVKRLISEGREEGDSRALRRKAAPVTLARTSAGGRR